jgi:nucleoside-diphosphate-sugar epimerase
MNIVVTGSTGRVGTNLIKRLSQGGHEIVGCLPPNDAHESKLDGMRVKKAHIDILDTDGMAAALKDADAVIHTAAVHEGSLSKISNTHFFDVNVKGMFNVLEGIRTSGKGAHLICLSSSAVYDVFTAPRTPIKESQDRKPITLYGMTKILVEEQVRQYAFQYDIPSTILRPNYIVTGPEVLDAFNYSVVFDVLSKYADNRRVQFHTPDDPDAWMAAKSSSSETLNSLCIPICPENQSWQWHMTDIRDVVDVIQLCLDNEKAHGKTFNIAGADFCDWYQIVPYISEKTGRGVVEVAIPNLWQYSFDQSESASVLGFTPKYDHRAMVDIAVAMANNEDVGIIRGETTMLA